MPINPMDSGPTRQQAAVVKFTWGTSPQKSALYIRWDHDVLGYTSAPELEVEPAEMHGGVQDTPWGVIIRKDRVPLTTLLRPYAHAPVTVEIGEADPADFAATYRVWWVGLLQKSGKGKDHPDLRRIEVAGYKARMNQELGVECLFECAHLFGDDGCKVDLEPLKESKVIASIAGKVLTFSTALSEPKSFWWRFGTAEYDGLILKVVVTSSPPSTATLLRPPPPEWVGKVVMFTPGCDRQIDGDCRPKWNNESEFIGLGYRMPKYNPLFDQGNT